MVIYSFLFFKISILKQIHFIKKSYNIYLNVILSIYYPDLIIENDIIYFYFIIGNNCLLINYLTSFTDC